MGQIVSGYPYSRIGEVNKQSSMMKWLVVFMTQMHVENADVVMFRFWIRYGFIADPFPGQPWVSKSLLDVILNGA